MYVCLCLQWLNVAVVYVFVFRNIYFRTIVFLIMEIKRSGRSILYKMINFCKMKAKYDGEALNFCNMLS